MTSIYTAAAPLGWPSARSSEIPFWEKGLTFAGLMIVMGTVASVFPGQQVDRSAGDFAYQVVSGLLFLSTVGIALYRGLPAWIWPLMRRSIPLIALTVLALASTLWSIAPEVTFRRAASLALTSAFAAYVILRYDLKDFVYLLAIGFALFVGVGIFAAFTGEGVTGGGAYSGAWRGLTGNKNEFGRTIALGFAVVSAAGVLGLIPKRMAIAIAAGCLVSLLLSRSATSFVTAFASLGVGFSLYVAFGGQVRNLRLSPVLGISLLVGFASLAGFILATNWVTILTALGRDPTLTGRTDLWVWAINLNEGREWLGAGFRSFWIDSNTRYFFLSFAWNKDAEGNLSDTFSGPSHSHSGYVDLYVELGFLGLIVAGITLLSALFHLRRSLALGNSQIGFLLAMILAFLLTYAITAKSILQQSEDLWFLVVAFYLYAVKENLLSKRKAEQQPTGEGTYGFRAG
jgi:O-antigen ligase